MKAALLALVCLAWAAPVRACVTAAEATPESTCVVLEREGHKGVWFDLATADTLRRFKLEVPELRLQVGKLEGKVDIRDEQLDVYRKVLDLKDLSIKQASASMMKFARVARTAREGEQSALDKLHAWYRSPALYFAGGLVVAAATVAVAAATTTR